MSHKPQADAIVDATIVLADLNAALVDPVAGTAGVRTLGTGAQQAAPGNDSRITGAEQTSNKGAANGYAPLNASSRVPVANLGSGTPDGSKFLRDDGAFVAPSATLTTTVSTKTTTYTSTTADDVLLADGAGGSFTITLHAASTWTKPLTIKKINTGTTNNITIDGNASETIDGAATRVITQQYESVTLVSNGSNIFVI